MRKDLANKIRAKKSNPDSDFSREEFGALIDEIKAEQSNPANEFNKFEENFKNRHQTIVEKSIDDLKN
jgi:hypothetical protein